MYTKEKSNVLISYFILWWIYFVWVLIWKRLRLWSDLWLLCQWWFSLVTSLTTKNKSEMLQISPPYEHSWWNFSILINYRTFHHSLWSYNSVKPVVRKNELQSTKNLIHLFTDVRANVICFLFIFQMFIITFTFSIQNFPMNHSKNHF